MTEQQNTRPSASREIAVKPLTFSDNGYAHNGLGTMYRITFHNDANIGWVLYRHEGSSKTGLGAHEDRDELITLACEDNERRILSAIDTTPGNTDPIAKYDDELRKVQGGWRDMDSAPDWEGFGRAMVEDWPTGDIEGSFLFDMALKYTLIREIPGGYDPDQHEDVWGICPDSGDAWYEYAFGPESAPDQPATEGPDANFQQRVQPWMMECFGPEISADVTERNHRFLEESLELVQSKGCTASEAHQLVDYVFSRDIGDPHQEVGGVMVTLAALCLAAGLNMDKAANDELARIWTKVDKIRAKQAAKPKHSPLPQHVEQPDAVQEAARVLLEHMPNYAMERAALESRARDDEGEFESLSDLLDFSGQNKSYTVVREALTAALRALEGGE